MEHDNSNRVGNFNDKTSGSKMITHEQARKILDDSKLYDDFDEVYYYSLDGETGDEIIDYITQQEKKDELLGLYREFSKMDITDDYMDIWDKIDKLENELKGE